MFKKLISNLAFSPALVGQLGFYAKRLKKEESLRKIGLVFTALALVVQSFAVFSPPESANAANSGDVIYGGVSSVSGLLQAYDSNKQGFRTLVTDQGITRDEIAKTVYNKIYVDDTRAEWLNWARLSGWSSRAQVIHSGGYTYYRAPLRDLARTEGNPSSYYAFIGKSTRAGYFAFTARCGNLQTSLTAPRPVPPAPTPKPVPPAPTPKSVPVASCQTITLKKIDRTRYSASGTVSAANGASFKDYLYQVKDASGKVVYTNTQPGPGLTSQTPTFELATPGTYTITLTGHSSLGDRTAPSCAAQIVVEPPEMCEVNPSLTKLDPRCKPCVDNPSLWIESPDCKAKYVGGKSAINVTRGGINATKQNAQASDRIEYSLYQENTGKVPVKVQFNEELSDVLEYATMENPGGGTYDKDKRTLTWPEVTLKPGEKQTRMFSVKMLDKIPSLAKGSSMPTSYDCKMNNVFSNTMVSIPVECPAEKVVVERTVSELPHTGPRENMIFAGVVFAVVVFFYARARQMKKEVRLIRRDFNAGTI